MVRIPALCRALGFEDHFGDPRLRFKNWAMFAYQTNFCVVSVVGWSSGARAPGRGQQLQDYADAERRLPHGLLQGPSTHL